MSDPTDEQRPPVLHVHPVQAKVQISPDQSVLQALQEHGIFLESPCDGQGICGQCTIRVHPAQAVPPTPHAHISEQDSEEGIRLACQCFPDQDVDIYLPPTYRMQAQSRVQEDPILMGSALDFGHIDPAVRLVHARDRVWLERDEDMEAALLGPDWKDGGSATGLAVDLGTTTIVLSLICLQTGRELASSGRLNPQVSYGHDVLTRIQKGSTPEGLDLLASSVHEVIKDMIDEVCTQAGRSPQEILDIVIGGNTTMLQLCARVDPAPLGHMPFEVGLASGCSYPASTFGFELNSLARVYVPPITHAFVGSDISAGLMAVPHFFASKGNMLFLDVGTNGEMGVQHNQTRMVTSTAAGPAFEGAGLSSGMRATQGAIQAVSFDGRDLQLEVIGNVPPVGLCGSGLLDLLHTLLELEIIDSSGRLRSCDQVSGLSPELRARRIVRQGKAAFDLGNGVGLTQEDIRQVQLAKGAVRTGIDLLLDAVGLTPAELDQIVISGGFGNVLRPANLEAVGMLPPHTAPKVVFAGNTSQTGCIRLLLSRSLRRRLEEDMKQVKHVALAQDTAFMDLFVNNLEFPQPEQVMDNQLAACKEC